MLSIDLAVGIPEASLRFLEPTVSRVVLVANNSEILEPVLASFAFNEHDIVVQFNKGMFFRELADYPCHKFHFFYPNHLGSCWGFSPDGDPELDYADQQSYSLTFAVAKVIPRRVISYLDKLGQRISWSMPRACTRKNNYPCSV